MPKPPILPLVDWQALYNAGQDYWAWIAAAQNKDNAAAMDDLRREQKLDPQVEAHLAALPRPVYVIAIAEDWCGDVVRHVPVLQKMAEAGSNLKLHFISREQSPETFIRFLTNGGEAIPKFVFLSDQFVECGNWGPMPEACRELISRGKACNDVAAARAKVSTLYAMDDEKRMVVTELLRLIDIASATAP